MNFKISFLGITSIFMIIYGVIKLVLINHDSDTRQNVHIIYNDVSAQDQQKGPEKKDQNSEDKTDQLTGLKKSSNPNEQKNSNSQKQKENFYTTEELKILQKLNSRRQLIAKREKELELKISILKANQKNLDAKIQEMKSLEIKIAKLIDQKESQYKNRISSLVKIYENMKPKDAAMIFEQLDIKIILDVISIMKEAKVAPILSKISPLKAMEISTRFAKKAKD